MSQTPNRAASRDSELHDENPGQEDHGRGGLAEPTAQNLYCRIGDESEADTRGYREGERHGDRRDRGGAKKPLGWVKPKTMPSPVTNNMPMMMAPGTLR